MRRLLTLLLVLIAAGVAVPLIAQEIAKDEKSGFLRFVEERISTPERRISFSGIEGALSSDVTIAEITFSDAEGVWMRIEDAQLNWNQTALLTGRLQINTLSAKSIEYIRQSIPAEGTPPSLEAPSFEIPQFPVAVFLENLSVPTVAFGEDLFGLGSEISIDGRLVLENGSLDTSLAIERKDGPGGALSLALKYDSESENTDIDLTLTEPRDGVIVNLLDMEEKPELSLRITGSGPLTELDTNLTLDAGGKRALTGLAQIKRASAGLDITADLYGPIADLVPAVYKDFFGQETKLLVAALVRDSGGVELGNLSLTGGELAVQASANTAADGFLKKLQLDARIEGRDNLKVLLPGGGATTALDAARLTINYGDGDAWTGKLTIDGLTTDQMSAQSIALNLDGAALNLDDPITRRITLNADGTISGIKSADPQIANAFGEQMGLGIAGLWSTGNAFTLAEARLRGAAFDVALNGNIDDLVFDGDISLATPSIAPFSGLAGRQLAGSMNLGAKGSVELLTGGFDLKLDGEAVDLSLDMDIADAIFAGQTRMSGRLARTAAGVVADGFTIGNDQSKVTANGALASDLADFEFTLALNDLGLLSKDATGALTAVGTAKGADGSIVLRFDAKVPTGTLVGHRLANAQLGFDGLLTGADVAGDINGSAFLDGFRVDLAAGVATEAGTNRLTGLKFSTNGTELTGDLFQGADGLMTGKLALQSANISTAAALLLTEAKGAAAARIELAPLDGKQSARIAAILRDVAFNDTLIGTADVDVKVENLLGVPAIDGTLNGTNVTAAGIAINTLNIAANHSEDATIFSAKAALANGAIVDTAGSLASTFDGYSVVLNRAQLQNGSLSASLIGSTQLTVSQNTFTLKDVTFDVGGGRITSSGTAGENLDLAVNVDNVPLAVVNAIMPDLQLGGSLSGKLHVSGKSSAPSLDFDISGGGVSAAMLAPYGVTPLQINASGTFAKDTLRIAALQADGPVGVTLKASGTLPLVGSNGDLQVTGNLPLALANKTVGGRGTQVSGTVAVNATITGSLAKPSFGGSISTTNAEIVDPLTNLRLQSIAANGRLAGEQIVIQSFTGNLATGGSISASGTVSLNAQAGFPADIQIGLNSARYADGNIFIATASGELSISGSLQGDALLSGNVRIENAEISIPDSIDTSAVLLKVDHKAIPVEVARTLERVRTDGTKTTGSGGSSALRFNVSVVAPNQIFVRGRGVDAELGGQLQLGGTINDIQPNGGFQLIRGRLDILGQRIVLNSGTVTLVGTLDPYIDLSAQSVSGGTTVFVNVKGPVSNLDIILTSEPELPQDEVLSQLIFKRALGDLSPLQLAKLAAAAVELAGGSNSSLVDSLRAATGLADLDVVTDAQGNAAVRAGAYIQDNVYISVDAGAQGDSKVSIDLDLTDTLKARGSATSDGETSVGVFYEQDY